MVDFNKLRSLTPAPINTPNFTKDQKEAINGITQFIADYFDTSKMAVGLIGAGGTGKTYLTDYLISHCKHSSSVIKCTSPTHKACRVFSAAIGNKKVDTIQSTFGLRLDLKLEDFDPKRPQFNPKAQPKLDNVKLLIIDEASMLPAKLVTYIFNKCKELRIKIILIGDGSQISPIGEKKSIAFDRCFKVYKLKEIVRQGATNPVGGLLDLLRQDIDKRQYKFLEYIGTRLGSSIYNELGEGFSIMGPEQFKQTVDTHFANPDYTRNIDMYRIIAYTNNCVSSWNHYIRNTIIEDADKKIITKNDLIMSYETIVDDFMDIVINNSEEYIVNELVDYHDETYDFKGFLVKFQLVHGGGITKPLFIVDHRDKYTINRYYNVLKQLVDDGTKATGHAKAGKWKAYYTFKKKYLLAANIPDKYGRILYKRDIDYGFAITSHKSQGSTYDIVFVDVNDMVYDKRGNPYANQDELLRRLYVACSRARKELILCYGRKG